MRDVLTEMLERSGVVLSTEGRRVSEAVRVREGTGEVDRRFVSAVEGVRNAMLALSPLVEEAYARANEASSLDLMAGELQASVGELVESYQKVQRALGCVTTVLAVSAPRDMAP